MARTQRNKMREQLKSRTQESHSRRDDSGGFKDYFNDKVGETPKWWAGKGDHIIDIIPYLAGTNDPRNKEGEPCYVLDVDVHRYVGSMDEMVICPEQFGKPCPICEEQRKRNKAGEDYKQRVKPLRPSRRCVYNVVVRDNGDMEKKGIQIFEIAHWFMEKHLSKISKNPRGGGYTVFSDPDDGKSISFERTGTGADNTGYSGHQFLDRPEVISDKEFEAALCLDDLIDIREYDEIADIFHGADTSKEEEPEQDEPDEPEEETEPKPEETKPEPEPEPEEAPIKSKRAGTRRSKQTTKEEVCPLSDGTIGVDIDEFDECDDCTKYDACSKIADNL